MGTMDFVIGGIAGALLFGGFSKKEFVIKDRSVLFKSKRNLIDIKIDILHSVFDINFDNDSENLDRELNWNNIYVEKINNFVFIECELIDTEGNLTNIKKVDLIKIANICKNHLKELK